MRVKTIVPRQNKKAQVTIFIIIAIMVVAFVGGYFVLRGVLVPKIAVVAEENPEAFMQLCIEEDLNEIVKIITLQGGFYEPEDFVLINNDNKATYLCKNVGNYEPCINQHPMYFKEITDEVKREISPVIEECFNDLKESYEEVGSIVELNPSTVVEVDTAPQNVFVNVKRDFSVTKNEETSNYYEINLGIRSSLYDLSHVAARIAHNEAEFCYFEFLGYMLQHPEYDIKFRELSDSTHVYTLIDKRTGDEMNIATRGCAMHD